MSSTWRWVRPEDERGRSEWERWLNEGDRRSETIKEIDGILQFPERDTRQWLIAAITKFNWLWINHNYVHPSRDSTHSKLGFSNPHAVVWVGGCSQSEIHSYLSRRFSLLAFKRKKNVRQQCCFSYRKKISKLLKSKLLIPNRLICEPFRAIGVLFKKKAVGNW